MLLVGLWLRVRPLQSKERTTSQLWRLLPENIYQIQALTVLYMPDLIDCADEFMVWGLKGTLIIVFLDNEEGAFQVSFPSLSLSSLELSDTKKGTPSSAPMPSPGKSI